MISSDFRIGVRHGKRDADHGVDGESARLRSIERSLDRPAFEVARLSRDIEPLEAEREQRRARIEEIELQSKTDNWFQAGPRAATYLLWLAILLPVGSEYVLARQVTSAYLGDSVGMTTFVPLMAVAALIGLGEWVFGSAETALQLGLRQAWVPLAASCVVFGLVVVSLAMIRAELYADQASTQVITAKIYGVVVGGSVLAMGLITRLLRSRSSLKGEWLHLCRKDREQVKLEARLAIAMSAKLRAEGRVHGYRQGYQQGIDAASRSVRRAA